MTDSLVKDKVAIPLNKMKIFLLTIGAAGFVVVGVLLVLTPVVQNIFGAIIAWAVALADIAFFGMCGIYGLIKLFDSKPGLVISREGIFDNSSAMAGGMIPWGTICSIASSGTQSQMSLIVIVADPEEFMGRQNSFKRFWMKCNYKFYGSPIHISTIALKRVDNLEGLIRRKWDEYENSIA